MRLRLTSRARTKAGGPQEASGAGGIVELILSIGFWGMVARLLETTEVDLEEYAGKVNLLEGTPNR